MKIRNGFVSNSSSSSFIVAVNPKEKCPHCGRSSMNIVDVLASTDWCNDTELKWTNPTEFINELEKEIEKEQLDLYKWKDMDGDDMVTSYTDWRGKEHKYKVSELRLWAKDTILANQKILDKINKALKEGKQVAHFDIDYHDPVMNDMVQEQIKNGELEVLDED